MKCPTCGLAASSMRLSALRVVSRYLVAKPSGPGLGWERRKENDSMTEKNIPPEHLLFFRRIKNLFKGTPDQRAEQFMEYLEEHPGESEQWLIEHADTELAKSTRKWEREQKEQHRLEQNCDKSQTKYEEAWYQEQERASQEKAKLKGLRERADATCRACPTCEQSKDAPKDDYVPF